jgi:hypothetical protein
MLPFGRLPHATTFRTDELDERALGLVRVWEKRFAPSSGSAAYVLRERLERRVAYIGRFRMYEHRYSRQRAETLAARFQKILSQHPEAEIGWARCEQRDHGWVVDAVFRTGLQDEAVAVLQEIVAALGLDEGLLRRAS